MVPKHLAWGVGAISERRQPFWAKFREKKKTKKLQKIKILLNYHSTAPLQLFSREPLHWCFHGPLRSEKNSADFEPWPGPAISSAPKNANTQRIINLKYFLKFSRHEM